MNVNFSHNFSYNPMADYSPNDLITGDETMGMISNSIEQIKVLKKLGTLRHIRKEVGDEKIRKLIIKIGN